jgi:hypothetical protein
MRVIVVGSTGGLIGSNLTVCLPPAPVGSLGGFYEIDDPVPGNDGCRVSNPFTGGCSCPGGYSAGQLRTLVDIAGSALIGAHIVQCTR